jgi:GR25 family glycosyltransferase involved in LPS biosynthesis
MIMKMYVIGIEGNELSMNAVERCIKSAEIYGHKVTHHVATTPDKNPLKILKKEGISAIGFEEVYSRELNCISAFLSHYSLWKKCVELNETILVLEHDAVFKGVVHNYPFQDICNFGKPSYGKYNTPTSLGLSPLTSKRYLPGAHAYGVTPSGARKLIEQAKVYARPTDVFIHLDVFPTVSEVYPWPVECMDDFTTIQNRNGCIAKHRYDYETYGIVNA